MMWHQLQLASAMEKARRIQAASSAGSGAPLAASSTSSTPSPSVVHTSSKRILNVDSAEEDWLKLSAWSAPGQLVHRIDDSEVHAATRQRALEATQACFDADLAASTIQSYDSLLLREVGQAQKSLNMDLLPMTEETQFLAFFGHLKAHHEEQLHWSRVRSLKSALLQWHKRRYTACVLTSWTPSMAAFWNGLSKSCIHEVKGKEPIAVDVVNEYLELQGNTDNPVEVRNAAMVAVAFYGMRRSAEVIQFQMQDMLHEDKQGRRLRVRCQKNDPKGLGQVCLIPCISSLGAFSPHNMLNRWMAIRNNITEDNTKTAPLFVTTTGANKGKAVSYDSLRKHVVQQFGVATSTHSLRKGGAVYYSRAGASEDATRQQGGWRTSEVMKSIYTTLSAKEVESELHKVANATSLAWAIRLRFKALGRSSEDILRQPPAAVQPFLAFVAGNISIVDKHILVEAKLAASLKVLTNHVDDAVRNHAIKLFTMSRSIWMAEQNASKKPKVA